MKVTATEYLQHFSCIGSDCEETCCKGWRILVNEDDIKRLDATTKGAELNQALKKSIKSINKKKRDKMHFAQLVMDTQGYCKLLDDAGLCSLHKELGHTALFDTCADYPRHSYRIGGEVYVSNRLSCPEAVRHCLFDTGHTEIVREMEVPLRPLLIRNPGKPDENDLYGGLYPNIIELFHALLALENFTYRQRLFFLAYFAEKSREHFYQGSRQVDVEQLTGLFNWITDVGNLQQLQQHAESLEFSPELLCRIGLDALLARMSPCSQSLSDLTVEVLRSYAGHGGHTQADLDFPEWGFGIDIGRLAAQVSGYQASWETLLPGHLDFLLQNYSRNFLLSDPYVLYDNLIDSLIDLSIRVMGIKILLLGHPRLVAIADAAAAKQPDTATCRKIFDEVAVECFYKFSRGFEHNTGHLESVQKNIRDNELNSFAGLSYLTLAL